MRCRLTRRSLAKPLREQYIPPIPTCYCPDSRHQNINGLSEQASIPHQQPTSDRTSAPRAKALEIALGQTGLGQMSDWEDDRGQGSIIMELDSETMWTLSTDKTTLSLNMQVPAVGGLDEPLNVSVEFDPDSVDAMIEQLLSLRARMVS